MTDDLTRPITNEEMYGDWGVDWDDLVAIADRSVEPRSRTSIYDTFGGLGVTEGDDVLDIGGRDGAQALELAERFGCRVLSVDPVRANVELARADIADHDYGHLVESRLGEIGDIPASDAVFDAIFSRDMMGHVADLDRAMSECRRVLRPTGAMLVHDVFATPLLEANEQARLCADLAQIPERLDGDDFEATVVAAGFAIEARETLGSEWLEHLLENEDAERRLLRASRLHRRPERFIAEMGLIPYRVFRGNNLWTIYKMIGKLEDRVYVLRA